MLTPFKKVCKSQLRAADMTSTISTASRACPDTPANTRGCPKTIPALGSSVAQDCGSGSGFWPIGSVCGVSCGAPGGGHRRAQAGGAFMICTQGGNWLTSAPLNCGGASPPPPPGSPTQGRFVAIDQPMSISASIAYCRQNYAALASIHTWEEQQQANAACGAMVADSSGRTVSEQASNGGYGCWIGFEDSAQQGGFLWEDGSSVDFVNWAPAEPNNVVGYRSGGRTGTAVAIDLRGHQGIMCDPGVMHTGCFRNGEWNDDSRADDYYLYPICETNIPPAVPGASRVWGTGATSSFNLKVCIDGTDTLYFQDDRLWSEQRPAISPRIRLTQTVAADSAIWGELGRRGAGCRLRRP